MEGLIPFIYKAIKEKQRQSYSRCSSTGSARGRPGGRVEDDGGAWDWKQEEVGDGKHSAESEMTAHRWHLSLEELAGEVGPSSEWQTGALPRGRSVRIFSCIGGM